MKRKKYMSDITRLSKPRVRQKHLLVIKPIKRYEKFQLNFKKYQFVLSSSS